MLGQDSWDRTARKGQTGQDRISWTGNLGSDNWDRKAKTGHTGQVGLISKLDRTERTGQSVHDNVWEMFIFAKMFTKTKIFVSIFTKTNIFMKRNFRIFTKFLLFSKIQNSILVSTKGKGNIASNR